MKRAIVAVAFGIASIAGTAGVAGAHEAPPCAPSEDPGHSGYAQHHIRNATADGDHVPGTHGGYSLCLGTGRSVHQP